MGRPRFMQVPGRAFAAACVLLCAVAFAAAMGASTAWADEAAPAKTGTGNPFETVAAAVKQVTDIGDENLFARRYDWTAVKNLDFDSANEDGSLSVWQPGWLISHDWSDYGRAIASLQPGDLVVVNGQPVLILGRDLWSNEVINWDVYDTIGWNKTVFQTCYGDNDIWIAYGLPVNPTARFLAAHGS